MIEVKNLAKSFGDVQAIKDVSFKAEDGAITTLLGANGSGKTTTLRAISGLLKLDQGRAFVDRLDCNLESQKAQQVMGIFPDSFGLYVRLTTREHLEYFAKLHGMSGTKMHTAIDHVTELLQMQDILDRKAEGFSQGQRMKVALARALVHQPKNLILDEPTRGLDVMSIRLLRGLMHQLKEAGCCILFSSHVMAEVSALSDHIVMIADGIVCAEGAETELVANSGCSNLEDAFVKVTGMDKAA
ncbi:ATP-binding cassette domain-containing protein [Temperatibacter marinus]|uniref:ATP-binding cassette domain-containing protein n=1 Tax=Temperatibacter marinus TaxID=1456591 RepID=A0AA52EGW7_9PROT|nr:ATP-binding cassette domain-containing protein [Temperatibacter marinus]WND02114.1 ATP-binding cassette domain-containing protein [Temperatibacter marinus]